MQVHELLNKMADVARCAGQSMPVIETDTASAHLFVDALREETGFGFGDLHGSYDDWSHVISWDGVEIRIRKLTNEDLYRDHFGVLAEIWSE